MTYVVGDRPNLNFQIGSDTPRLFYDHLVKLGDKIPKLDLFLYSSGGDASVPWRIISLFREFADEINVLVPYRAYSAATMICMGSDNILMGRKGELGPIDPTVVSDFNPVDPVNKNRKMPINVEDIASFKDLFKYKFNITSSRETSDSFLELTKAVNPIALGYINRHYSFIRMVATKLLQSHKKPFDDGKIPKLVEELIEKIYFHGHGIARKEAKRMGLHIDEPDMSLENLMWNLYVEYEDDLRLADPLIAKDILEDKNADTHVLSKASGAYIESENFYHVFETDVKLSLIRALPQNLTINTNLQLPANPDQSLDQQQLAQLQKQIEQLVREQVKKQSPIVGTGAELARSAWRKKDWPTTG